MPNIQKKVQPPIPPQRRRPGMPSPGQGGGGMTGKDITRILRKRKLLILIFLVAFTALSIAGTKVWKDQAPIYKAEAVVQISPPTTTMLGSNMAMNTAYIEREKNSQIRMIKSVTVIKAALKLEAMTGTEWYKELRKNDAALLKAQRILGEDILINQYPETSNVGISMRWTTSDATQIAELATVVNQIANAFVKVANDRAQGGRHEDVRKLKIARDGTIEKDGEDGFATKLKTILDNIEGVRAEREVTGMRRQVDALLLEYNDLTRRITDLQVLESEAMAGRESLSKQRTDGLLQTHPTVMQTLEIDPMLRHLQQLQASLEVAFYDANRKYGPKHRLLQTLQLRLDDTVKRTEQRANELTNKTSGALLVAANQRLATYQAQLFEVTQRRQRVEASRQDLLDGLADIEKMEKEADILREKVARIDMRLDDLNLVKQNVPVVLLQPATEPLEPDWPKMKILVPLGIAVGLLIGVGLAFLLELIDTSVKTPTDITRRVDLPLLALVPHADDVEDEIADFRTACISAPHSLVTEAYRELRTNLLFSGPAAKRKTLLVTSPSPDDGRTSVAVNLAAVTANSGRRVLLIDANFRRPAIAALFGREGVTGLSEVLSAQAQWEDCVHDAGVPNLSIMTSGPLPPNPNELLGGELAKQFLEEVSGRFDQVIVDGPPLLLISDANMMATQVDGVILVVRAGENTYGIVQRCRDSLTHIGAHTVGAVLNGIRVTTGGYLQKNYDAFYDYHEVGE